MPEPLTPERLAEIRSRDAEWRKLITEPGVEGHPAAEDRSVLLAEVERLRSLIGAALDRADYLTDTRDALRKVGNRRGADRHDFAAAEIRELFAGEQETPQEGGRK